MNASFFLRGDYGIIAMAISHHVSSHLRFTVMHLIITAALTEMMFLVRFIRVTVELRVQRSGCPPQTPGREGKGGRFNGR